MKKRGAILLLAAVPAWIYSIRSYYAALKGPFGYEFGSIAYPIPPLLRIISLIAIILTSVGLALFAVELFEWIRKKRHDNTN
ncbi:MAG: hypothetical protein HY234_08870 [Acidobacteria bacterium]|nr:hypothetical protein [Acidobacteriota bacterium]MBI3663145.1 hypothetical protein [Acidobacteriota bacterium]